MHAAVGGTVRGWQKPPKLTEDRKRKKRKRDALKSIERKGNTCKTTCDVKKQRADGYVLLFQKRN